MYESVLDIRTSGLSLGLPRAFFDTPPLIDADGADDADMCCRDKWLRRRAEATVMTSTGTSVY